MLHSAHAALKGATLALARLFVDDASLAICVVLILVATAFLTSTPWHEPTLAAGLFVAALVAALLENVVRSSRSSPPDE